MKRPAASDSAFPRAAARRVQRAHPDHGVGVEANVDRGSFDRRPVGPTHHPFDQRSETELEFGTHDRVSRAHLELQGRAFEIALLHGHDLDLAQRHALELEASFRIGLAAGEGPAGDAPEDLLDDQDTRFGDRVSAAVANHPRDRSAVLERYLHFERPAGLQTQPVHLEVG